MAGPLRVLGIDPGSQCLGWGLVEETSGMLRLVDCGAIRPKGETFSQRLGQLYTQLARVVREVAPHEAAIENVFTCKNMSSALKLGQARGIAVGACAAEGIPVADYEPTLVKQTLVGTGRAEKEQVSFMVGRLLNTKPTWGLDTGDALAVALCHLQMRRLQILLAKQKK